MIKKIVSFIVLFILVISISQTITLGSYLFGNKEEGANIAKDIIISFLPYLYTYGFDSKILYQGNYNLTNNKVDIIISNHINTIDCIVIENQISPIANRMKTLQGLIAQYFIMNNRTKIEFISAANKLKGHVDLFETDISTYSARKKEGIKVMEKILNELSASDEKNEVWLFNSSFSFSWE